MGYRDGSILGNFDVEGRVRIGAFDDSSYSWGREAFCIVGVCCRIVSGSELVAFCIRT